MQYALNTKAGILSLLEFAGIAKEDVIVKKNIKRNALVGLENTGSH